mmetsp:Transcript_12948/g.30779  ORF Transcript_12948/g.30779 Transcript_12948/m.30779 type:complete len:90 (+) Transcript_12948:360-629(+)
MGLEAFSESCDITDEAKVVDCFNERSDGFSGTDLVFATGLSRDGMAFGFGLDMLLMFILGWLRPAARAGVLVRFVSQRLNRSSSKATSS